MTQYDDFGEPSELDVEREIPDHGLVKPGWYCSLELGHDGPCACWPVSHYAYAPELTAREESRDRLVCGAILVGYIVLFLLGAHFV